KPSPSGDRRPRPQKFADRDASKEAREPKEAKPGREPRLFTKGEAKSIDGPRPKRGSRPFDTRDKYSKGELKYPKKSFSRGGDDRTEDRGRSFVQQRRLKKIEKDLNKDTIRLNKYIANSGICSRREADELITQGLVEVN